MWDMWDMWDMWNIDIIDIDLINPFNLQSSICHLPFAICHLLKEYFQINVMDLVQDFLEFFIGQNLFFYLIGVLLRNVLGDLFFTDFIRILISGVPFSFLFTATINFPALDFSTAKSARKNVSNFEQPPIKLRPFTNQGFSVVFLDIHIHIHIHTSPLLLTFLLSYFLWFDLGFMVYGLYSLFFNPKVFRAVRIKVSPFRTFFEIAETMDSLSISIW